MNKYTLWYNSIIENARTRILTCYKESHHILPRSLGGTDEKHNLVDLTAKEHFICHWLLVKMTEGTDKSKMLYALQGMKAENKYQERYHTKITARVYEKYRIEHAKNHSEVMKSKNLVPWNKGRKLEGEELEMQRDRIRNRKFDPIKQAEGQQKRIAKVLGRKDTEEAKLKKSLALRGKPKGPMSEEQKKARSMTMTGQKKTKSHAVNVASAVLGNISINKDNVEKKVKKDTLQSYLSDGWQLGGKKRKTV